MAETERLRRTQKARVKMQIRSYREYDEAAVVDLWREVFPDARPWNHPETDIRRKLTVQPELFYVALLDGEPVGTAMAGYDGHRGWVYLVAVRPPYRRIGIGTALMRRVEEALDDEADTKRLQPPLIGMRCLLASSILGAPAGSNPVFRAYGRGVALRSLEVVEAYVEAARRPFPECFLEAERLGAKLEARIPWYDPVSREVAGSLPRFWLEEQRIVARLGGTRVALAALRYKAAHGRLPARLQDLVPDFIDSVPLDPFDGKPLRYRKADDGFVVYAVGENGADDGGQTELVKDKRLDVGFRVRWPRKAP